MEGRSAQWLRGLVGDHEPPSEAESRPEVSPEVQRLLAAMDRAEARADPRTVLTSQKGYRQTTLRHWAGFPLPEARLPTPMVPGTAWIP